MAKTEINKNVKQGPVTVQCTYTSYTTCHFDHNGKDYSLFYKGQYDLPDIPFVRSLIAQEKLVIIKNDL